MIEGVVTFVLTNWIACLVVLGLVASPFVFRAIVRRRKRHFSDQTLDRFGFRPEDTSPALRPRLIRSVLDPHREDLRAAEDRLVAARIEVAAAEAAYQEKLEICDADRRQARTLNLSGI